MSNNTQIEKNENTELLRQKMEQRMKGIYKDIRDLFFCFENARLPEFENFNPPKIELSDVVKTKILGKYPLEQVIRIIESMMNRIRTADRLKEAVSIIELIIKDYNCGEIRSKSNFEWLLKKLCDILDKALADGEGVFNNDGDNRIIEAIDLLKNTQKTITISGEFSAEKNLITLYTKANQQCSDSNSYSNSLLTTLAHEMFHAMHCYLTGKNQWDKEDTEAKTTVIESLARWTEYCWCRLQGKEFQSIADKLKLEWETSDFPADPYSGAKVFANEDVLDLDVEVLDASKKDWNKAYTMMESHRHNSFLKNVIDDETGQLFFWSKGFRELTRNADTEEWAILHLHSAKMSEKDNLELCETVQHELEQKEVTVTRIQCKGLYLKRSNELVEGDSAVLFIKNELHDSKSFIDVIQIIADRFVNIYYPILGVISKSDDDSEVQVIYKSSDEDNVSFVKKNYGSFDEYSAPSIFQDIFKRLCAINPYKIV